MGGGGDCRCFMYRRINPQRELARKLLARFNTIFSACFEKNLQRNPAFPLQSFHILGIEVCPSIEPKKFASEHLNFRIESNHGQVAVNDHCILHTHGLTP